MSKIKKILAPTDLSELSCIGLRYALETGREQNAEVIVCLTVPIGEDWFPSSEGANPARDYTAKDKVKLDEFLRNNFSDAMKVIEVRQKVELGAAAAAIVETAEREAVDMIIMSTHGRTGLSHILIGSVTEKVVERAPCPVLVVPRQHTNVSAKSA
jgi:nucleotide-binding universal stress UspA family protein